MTVHNLRYRVKNAGFEGSRVRGFKGSVRLVYLGCSCSDGSSGHVYGGELIAVGAGLRAPPSDVRAAWQGHSDSLPRDSPQRVTYTTA